MLIQLKKKQRQFYKIFPLLFMFANMQSVWKKLENIVLNNFWSTDTTNVTGIKQLSCWFR